MLQCTANIFLTKTTVTVYLNMFFRLFVKLKMACPRPKHVDLSNKIEFCCVWTDTNFVY
jgi:hypothetical protein